MAGRYNSSQQAPLEQEQRSAGPSGNGSACAGVRSAVDLRSAMEDALPRTLQVLGATGVNATIGDFACNSMTLTFVSTTALTVQGGDMAAAVARALSSPVAEQQLESLLAQELDLTDLVVSLVVEEPSD
ncbi:hypothetical protein VOLCADRAFT_93531 [Volvox carteri f. nagariensis]|uniref:Uncharacterized protein n=1 Tax=Volvox carteri f. nagariensis TaxID=3068 RepID=D8U2D0_VOLCA|nr:uncharacterized protein VOLCADRAFT_93531 [Volvox carteri f. nagariensis]EFJ46042.1 hypothetical protein VOLCADRAFT_93531 [Volvox carteri f. nagariensis]|eukprot:XP_002952792.1 hypothetical protein VOLCADRAFT_93531 [Volvox carteri f. nagariensis]